MKHSSDEYGFAAAAMVGLHVFETSARSTGRTLRLVERVTDDDVIIVPSAQMARDMERRLRDAGKKTKVRVVEPGENPLDRQGTMPRGRAFFEHEWVRQHFMRTIEHGVHTLDVWQKAMSKTWPEAPEQIDESGGKISERYRVDLPPPRKPGL